MTKLSTLVSAAHLLRKQRKGLVKDVVIDRSTGLRIHIRSDINVKPGKPKLYVHPSQFMAVQEELNKLRDSQSRNKQYMLYSGVAVLVLSLVSGFVLMR